MKPAEVALIVDRKSFQEISLWEEGEVITRPCGAHLSFLSSSICYDSKGCKPQVIHLDF